MSTRNETLLDVEGMSCRSCIGHIDEALRGLAGVDDVQVRLGDGQVLVRHQAGTPLTALVDALREVGYEASVDGALPAS